MHLVVLEVLLVVLEVGLVVLEMLLVVLEVVLVVLEVVLVAAAWGNLLCWLGTLFRTLPVPNIICSEHLSQSPFEGLYEVFIRSL